MVTVGSEPPKVGTIPMFLLLVEPPFAATCDFYIYIYPTYSYCTGPANPTWARMVMALLACHLFSAVSLLVSPTYGPGPLARKDAGLS